jgi:hypothetical protein
MRDKEFSSISNSIIGVLHHTRQDARGAAIPSGSAKTPASADAVKQ